MASTDGKQKMRIPFVTTPLKEWLDEKQKVDGAEGLWRIHDKLYDFTIWSRTHPGGNFWLDISRGTDITEAFESHHFSGKAEEILKNYYIREAATPRYTFYTFDEDGFYKAFKRKVSRLQSTLDTKDSFVHFLINDSLAIAVFLTGLLGTKHGIMWTLLSGVLLGLLSVSCHSFIHKKNNWRVYYFHLMLMSSREWKIRHLLGHHQYRNTTLDLEIPVWQPLSKILNNNVTLLDFLLFPFAAHVQFLQRWFDVFLCRKLRLEQEEIVSFILPLFLSVASRLQPWEVFVTWNLIVLTGSFFFCLLSFPKYQTEINLTENTKSRNKQDFGIFQLSLIGSNPKENKYIFSFLNSFRGNVLHYLCPTINCGSLGKLIPVFEETVSEFGILHEENSGSFLEGLQNGTPQGHVFFS